MKQFAKKITSKGFTLIELIVVLAVLLFVIGTAIGIFISIVRHQRIILIEQEILSQTSYALEHISKALRMAKKQDSTGSCLGGDNIGHNYLLTNPIGGFYTGIKFINQSDNDVCQEFYLDNSDIQNPVLKEKKNGSPSNGAALTSVKFMINSVRFSINGGDGSISETVDNSIQPRVTIYLDIQTKVKGSDGQPIQAPKRIQTTISQRNLNVSQ